jgi:putative ABC transport system permease protein
METFWQHLRYSVRGLFRSKSFAVVVILTLALGIGANTALFSVVDGVLLRPAPVDALHRLAMVWETDRNSGTTREPASVPDYLDFLARSRNFEELAAFMGGEVNMTPPTGDPVRLAALMVAHPLLPMLGIKPVLGRTFTEEEDRAHGPRVALISEALWAQYFNRDPLVIGRTLRIDDAPYTVLGVMPAAADFGVLQILSAAAYSRAFADRGARTQVDLWTPLQPDPESYPRETHPIFVLGRLAPEVGAVSAQQEVAAIAADLERIYRVNAGRGVFVEPLAEVVFGPVRPALLALLGAVALVLVVACVNVANLLLVRGAGRVREVAARLALGAGGRKLMLQFLTEGLVLTFVAGAVGIALAFGGLKALLAIAPADIPRLSAVAIDLRVLAATLVISVLVGLAFGLVPMLQARRVDLQTALKGSGGWHASVGRERSRLRAALVIAELALAVVLVIGAGLLIKSFWRLQQVDPGFRAAGVLKAEYQLPPARYPVNFSVYPNFKEMHAFTDALLQRVAALPGVEAAAVAGNHPLDHGFTNSFQVVGREAEARNWPEISVRRATPGYSRTVGLSLLHGRLLRESDSTSAAPVLLINQAAARRFFPGQDPLGARIRFWGAERTIVGVVANEKFHGLTADEPLAVYLPLAQSPSANGAGVLLVRTSAPPLALASAVRVAIRQIDPGLAVFGVEPLEQTLSRSVSQRRFTMLLLVIFAAVALALASVGIHGVLSYSVAQRTREVGIRIALGARPARVLGLVVGEGAVLALAGIAIGLAGAYALTRLLSSLLFGVTATDPATFIAVACLLAAVALVASFIPARRATRIDPASALRAE